MPPTLIVGVDLSTRSPAVAAIQDGQIDIFCVAQKKFQERDRVVQLAPSANLHVLPRSCAKTDHEKTDYVLDRLFRDAVFPLIRECLNKSGRVKVALEGYAFSRRKNAGCSYKLYELQGCLKYTLRKTFPEVSVSVVPPTAWKKKVVGKAFASKSEVYQKVKSGDIHSLPPLPLAAALGEKEPSRDGCVPNPVQDCCDAVCIAKHLFD